MRINWSFREKSIKSNEAKKTMQGVPVVASKTNFRVAEEPQVEKQMS